MSNRWGIECACVLPAMVALIGAAALGLPMADASAQGAGGGIEGTAWLVEDIAGRGVIDLAQTTIDFDSAGRVSGSTGCNRYTGVATRDGTSLRFGQLATTRRACVPALMDQEQRFSQAMQDVRSYTVTTSGLLHLLGANGEALLRLAPLPTAESGGNHRPG
jgi:heat shock protein HslJ